MKVIVVSGRQSQEKRLAKPGLIFYIGIPFPAGGSRTLAGHRLLC